MQGSKVNSEEQYKPLQRRTGHHEQEPRTLLGPDESDVGSLSAASSGPVVSVGSFPKQRLVIEPSPDDRCVYVCVCTRITSVPHLCFARAAPVNKLANVQLFPPDGTHPTSFPGSLRSVVFFTRLSPIRIWCLLHTFLRDSFLKLKLLVMRE